MPRELRHILLCQLLKTFFTTKRSRKPLTSLTSLSRILYSVCEVQSKRCLPRKASANVPKESLRRGRKCSGIFYVEGVKLLRSKFCGHAHYGDCIEETRPFPGSKSKKRYPICTVCLKKLFLKDLFDEYTARVKEKEDSVETHKNEFRRYQKEYTELKTNYDQRKRDIKSEQKRQKQIINELQIKIANARKEQRAIEEEQERIAGETREAVKNERETNEKFDTENANLDKA